MGLSRQDSRRSSWPRNQTDVSCISRWFSTTVTLGKPQEYTHAIYTHVTNLRLWKHELSSLRMWIKESRVSPEILSFQPNGNFQAVVKGGVSQAEPSSHAERKDRNKSWEVGQGDSICGAKYQRELQRENTWDPQRAPQRSSSGDWSDFVKLRHLVEDSGWHLFSRAANLALG